MSNLTEFVDEFLSSDSDSEESTVQSKTSNSNKYQRRKDKVYRNWIKKLEFETAELAEEYVKSSKTWKKITSYVVSDGRKITYRCTEGQYRKNECPMAIYLLYHADSFRVSLFETKSEHSNHTDKNRGLSTATKELVKQLFKEGVKKPKAIKATFHDRGLKEPNKTKLQHYLGKLRNEKFDKSTLSTDKSIQLM